MGGNVTRKILEGIRKKEDSEMQMYATEPPGAMGEGRKKKGDRPNVPESGGGIMSVLRAYEDDGSLNDLDLPPGWENEVEEELSKDQGLVDEPDLVSEEDIRHVLGRLGYGPENECAGTPSVDENGVPDLRQRKPGRDEPVDPKNLPSVVPGTEHRGRDLSPDEKKKGPDDESLDEADDWEAPEGEMPGGWAHPDPQTDDQHERLIKRLEWQLERDKKEGNPDIIRWTQQALDYAKQRMDKSSGKPTGPDLPAVESADEDDDGWISLDEMAGQCEGCAGRMKEIGMTRIRKSHAKECMGSYGKKDDKEK